MKSLRLFVVALAVSLLTLPSFAEDPKLHPPVTQQQAGTLQPTPVYLFDCRVQGTPVEFPDDIYTQCKATVE